METTGWGGRSVKQGKGVELKMKRWMRLKVCELRQGGWKLKMKSKLGLKVCELRQWGVELKDELWIEPKGLWSKAEGVWWRPVMLEYASRTTESNCCSALSWQWRAYRHTPPSAIPGTRAKQPNSNFGIPKGKQSLKKQAKSANAAFLVVHKTIIAKRSAEEFKVSEGDGCQWHVKWSGWTPPTPATTHLEGLPQGQALSPV